MNRTVSITNSIAGAITIIDALDLRCVTSIILGDLGYLNNHLA